jgi:hypothetical protein
MAGFFGEKIMGLLLVQAGEGSLLKCFFISIF